MKKMFAIITIALFALAASAQVFSSQSFIASGVDTITLAAGAAAGSLTNGYYNGIVWTNTAGTQYTSTNNVADSDAATDYKNLCADVELWARRDGSVPLTMVTNNVVAAVPALSDMNITIRLEHCAAGAGSAVTFIFKPLFDGVNVSTETGDVFTTTVTANGTTAVTKTVNVPIWLWPGARKLRLVSASNADADTAAILAGVTLNGFRP